ncbi:MAG: hypothetical protein ACRD0K_11305 [Egibacteraceae bacterium]
MAEAAMELRDGLRDYEADVVDRVTKSGTHLVLPQGAATAVIGLELIRRLDGPAVVFCANISAQLGWQRTLSRFADPAGVTALCSLDAQASAPITVLTWDDLAPAEAAASLVSDLVIDAWADELVDTGRARDTDAARARIGRWTDHNPRKVARSLRLARAQLAVRLLRTPPTDLGKRITEPARQLFETLAEHGVRLIVLDGCDQATAGRALFLRHLIARLIIKDSPPAVVGLSTVPCTVPRAHRYCRILIPAPRLEVPTPPVVHAGDVAPHRDLVYFVEPTPQERARLELLAGDTRRVRTAAAHLLGVCEEKARATAEILRYEHVAHPDALRAIVLAECEPSAIAAFAEFLAEPGVQALAPVLLTRAGLVTASGQASPLLASCTASLERLGLRARCVAGRSTIPGATLIIGLGEDWSSRAGAMLAMRAMTAGVTRAIIGGADGALVDGWDAFEFDTLIDLSSRPTLTAARLRGRALRLDESAKVAHVWHIVAVQTSLPLGDLDVRRFVRRMADRWALPLDERGKRVIRGPAAFDPRLATGQLSDVDYRAINARCLTQIGDRATTRQRWTDGPSEAEIVTSVDAADIGGPCRLAPLLSRLRVPLALTAFLIMLLALTYGTDLPASARLAGQIAVLATAIVLGAAGREVARIVRVTRGSADARLAARGRAVLDALRACGHVNPQLGADAVRVRQTGPRRFEVRLDQGSIRDARVFATALTETLAPPDGQPYVIDAGAQIVPVPAVLSADPEVFLEHWLWYTGLGRLVSASRRKPPRKPSRGRAVALEVWEPACSPAPPS